MSTAALVPETWGLEEDDARQTLAHVGRRRLIKDGFKRMRYSDGFSHARSLAFLGILLFVEGVIAAIGIARVLGSATFAKAIANALESILPGPAERVLENAAGQANQAASSGYWLAIAFGTIGALITGASLMGQIERALNRIYGIEADRDTLQKYGRAFLLALSAGVLSVVALGVLGLGAGFFSSLGAKGAATYWSIARWPLGILLLIAAIALIFRWSPRRRQPAWSWMSFGAIVAVALLVVVTVALNLFFQLSPTFGSTYGPLAGIIALAFWAFGSSIALLIGAALAAQLEAVRAGAPAPRSVAKTVESEPGLRAVAPGGPPPIE
jgi:YihY family inner membrane protein